MKTPTTPLFEFSKNSSIILESPERKKMKFTNNEENDITNSTSTIENRSTNNNSSVGAKKQLILEDLIVPKKFKEISTQTEGRNVEQIEKENEKLKKYKI